MGMRWELNIPKIFHIYWGGEPMCFLRFMTIKTFMKYNPDWKIMLWYPKFPSRNITWNTGEQKGGFMCKDFLPDVMELPIVKTPIDFTEYGFSNEMSEVHKSDFIRLQLLSTIGGLWSDMDIIYFKPMTDLYFNIEENNDVKTVYCNRVYRHSIGFLMGSESNRFYSDLRMMAQRTYRPNHYQIIGAMTFNSNFNTPESIEKYGKAINMSMDVVYSHNCSNIPNIINGNEPKFTKESIGLHWYGGDPLWVDFITKTNGGLENLPDSIIGNLLKNEQ